jgi:hypothetical protein
MADGSEDDNPDRGWTRVSHSYFGIDQGPMLLMIENHRSELVWELIHRNQYIQSALRAVYQG